MRNADQMFRRFAMMSIVPVGASAHFGFLL